MKLWRDEPTEENFWGMVVSYAGVGFKTLLWIAILLRN